MHILDIYCTSHTLQRYPKFCFVVLTCLTEWSKCSFIHLFFFLQYPSDSNCHWGQPYRHLNRVNKSCDTLQLL